MIDKKKKRKASKAQINHNGKHIKPSKSIETLKADIKQAESQEETALPLSIIGQMTRAQRSLLAVLMDKKYYSATDTDKAKAAGISRSTFYELLRNEDFQELVKTAAKAMVANKLAPIMNALTTTAEMEGREGTQDRRTALELGGMIAGKGGKIEVNNNFDFRNVMEAIDGDSKVLHTIDNNE